MSFESETGEILAPKFTKADAYKYLGELATKAGMAQIEATAWSVLLLLRGQTQGQIRKFLETCKTPDGKTISWASKALGFAGKMLAGPVTPDFKASLYPLTALQAHVLVVDLFKSHRAAFGDPPLNDFYKVCQFPAPCDASTAILAELLAERERAKAKADPDAGDASGDGTAPPPDKVETVMIMFASMTPAERQATMERMMEAVAGETPAPIELKEAA